MTMTNTLSLLSVTCYVSVWEPRRAGLGGEGLGRAGLLPEADTQAEGAEALEWTCMWRPRSKLVG